MTVQDLKNGTSGQYLWDQLLPQASYDLRHRLIEILSMNHNPIWESYENSR
jgi:hypothetical protein